MTSLRHMFTLTDKPADEYLPYFGHIADRIVLLDDGTHVGMLRVDGKSLTLMDETTRYAERRRRHATMRALADSNVTIVEHHVCHDHVEPFPLGQFRTAFSRDLASRYHAGIQPDLTSREWIITVMVHPRPLEGMVQRLFGGDPKADEALMAQVEEKMATLVAMLREYHPQRLGVRLQGGIAYSEISEALRLVLYGRWRPVPMSHGHMAGPIYTDRVICGMRGFEVASPEGSTFGLMLGFKEYPEAVRPDILDGLLKTRHRVVMTNSFRYRSASAASRRMSLRQRRMANAGDRAESLREGLDEAIDDVQSGRSVMGDHHWSLAVHADSIGDLRKAVGEIKNAVAKTLSVAQEDVGCFPAFWAQVPGTSEATRARHGDVKLMNFCSFSSLCGFPRSDQHPHWERPTIRFVTSGNTAHDYVAHSRRVGQTLLIGPTGYGKSTVIGLFDALLEQNLIPRGGMSVILDKDASNELSVLARGGYYVKIRKGRDSGMAPLKAVSNTPEARAWLEEFIVGLIMADGREEPPADQLERIRYAIVFILRQPVEQRSLGGLRQFLDHGDGSTGSRLERWCRGGALGWAFDGDVDLIRLEAGVVGIDNTELLPDDMIMVRGPAASYQFFRIRQKVGRGIRAAVYVDEGASYLPDERFAAGFDAFSRELRKGNGLLWFAVHQPQDLLNHPVGQVLITNCSTKLLFPNPFADEAVYRDALKCSPGEVEAVVQGMLEMGEGTFLVKRPKGSFVARAPIKDPEFIAVLSSDPIRSTLWHEIAAELGTTDPDAIWAEYRNRHEEAQA
jgi:type IV secretion system protein VirB4